MKPARVKPGTDANSPGFASDLKGIREPGCPRLDASKAGPTWPSDCNDAGKSSVEQSATGSDRSEWAVLHAEAKGSDRPKLCGNDKGPELLNPKHDGEEPKQPRLRGDDVEPGLPLSSTGRANTGPERTKPKIIASEPKHEN